MKKLSDQYCPTVFLQQITVVLGCVLFFLSWWTIKNVGYNYLDSVLFVSIAIFCIFALIVSRDILICRQDFLMVLSFSLWVVVVDLVSLEFLPALSRDVQWLILPLLVWVFRELIYECPSFFRGIRIVIAIGLLAICLELFESAEGVFNWIYSPVFGNARRLGMSVGVMTVALYCDSSFNSRERFFLQVARVVGLSMLLWSGSRGSFLAWGTAFVLYAWFVSRKQKQIYVLELSAAIILASSFDADTNGMGIWSGLLRLSSFDGGVDTFASGRLLLWAKTASVLTDPYCAIFGAGGNGFVRLMLMFSNQSLQPHNVILQVLTDWGLVGFLLLSVLVIRMGWRRGGGKNITDKQLQGYSILIFLIIVGLLDGGLYHLEYLLYAALGFSLLGPNDRVVYSNEKFIFIPRFMVLIILFAAIVLHLTLRDYRVEWRNTPLSDPLYAYGVCAVRLR